MNELMHDQLRVLADNQVMLSAIETVFRERVEKEQPEIRPTDSDEVLGQKYRAYETAKIILNWAIKDIEAHKDNPNNSKKFNRGK